MRLNFMQYQTTLFFANSNDDYSAGGVGVFVRNIFDCEIFRYNLLSTNVLKVSLKINSQEISIICVYRRHSESGQFFLEEFSNFLYNEKASNAVILGDLNLDIL